jgi:Family of unknown function (DUF6152)
MVKSRIVAVGFLLMVAAAPVSAHHSRAEFDSDSVTVLRGTVTRFVWSNPHVFVYVQTKDDEGMPIEWEAITDAIPILARSGWKADSFAPGDVVTLRANPNRNPEKHHVLLVSIEKNGSILVPRETERAPSSAHATSLAGVWELPDGGEDTGDFSKRWRQVALTEKARAAKAAFTPEDRPAAQCIAPPTPMIMAMPYLNEVELGDDTVILRNEFFNVKRIVYMDGRPHPENGERTIQGHSIGWWEGDTLVVDTALFADHRAPIRGPNEGVPSGAERHVVEKYRLSDDGTRMLIDFMVEDPEYLAEPFTGTLQWVYRPQLEMMGFDCERSASY